MLLVFLVLEYISNIFECMWRLDGGASLQALKPDIYIWRT